MNIQSVRFLWNGTLNLNTTTSLFLVSTLMPPSLILTFITPSLCIEAIPCFNFLMQIFVLYAGCLVCSTGKNVVILRKTYHKVGLYQSACSLRISFWTQVTNSFPFRTVIRMYLTTFKTSSKPFRFVFQLQITIKKRFL